MLIQPSFGTWLRRRRKSMDLTRAQLAAQIGYSSATIRKIEAEERRPSQQVVEQLVGLFNIPPGEHAQFQRFARGNLHSASIEPGVDAPWQLSSASLRSHLPSPSTSLIARDKEIADLISYLSAADIRLVTLTGPPGIGKTRLSLEAAHALLSQYQDGVYFIPLASLDDPALIAATILQTLGYAETRAPQVINLLKARLRNKNMLLVLDDCEHFIEEIALLTNDLLTSFKHLNILVTSREALRVPGEWIYTVPALSSPEEGSPLELESISDFAAISLFAERARAERADFVLTDDNLQSVADICRLSDGLPLAIELLAARMRVMSPQALLLRLNAEYILSADGRRAVPARQKTLHNAINWSFSTLSPEEEMIFTHSAVFSGGFTLEAAEAIFQGTPTQRPVPDLITRLADKSLLQRVLSTHGEARYFMLSTIKQFALQRLRLRGEEDRAHDSHLIYYLDLAEKGASEMRGPLQVEWGKRLESEQDNFRAALEWSTANAKTETALRLLCALGWTWEVHGHYCEAHCWLDRIRSQPDEDKYPLLLAKLLNHIGQHSISQGDLSEARSLLEESLALSQESGTEGEVILAETLSWLGLVVLYADQDANQAKSMLEAGLKLVQKLDDRRGVALSTLHLGIAEIEQDNHAAAAVLLQQSLALFHQVGDMFSIARASTFLGSSLRKEGAYDNAPFSLNSF